MGAGSLASSISLLCEGSTGDNRSSEYRCADLQADGTRCWVVTQIRLPSRGNNRRVLSSSACVSSSQRGQITGVESE